MLHENIRFFVPLFTGRNIMIREAIQKLFDGLDLTEAESHEVANKIMDGTATPSQIAAFITALSLRGEKKENVVGFARTMREKAKKIHSPAGEIVLDTCGTGGDRVGTFNISTAAAFIASGAGVKVAKHGNRSVSSNCGSADVLKALGVNIEAPTQVSQKCLDELGIAFLFAPLYHGAMKYAIGPRREIGIRTIFNIVGPLSNPAGATHQLVGVFDNSLLRLFMEVLKELGSKRALAVRGDDGLDEITTTTTTHVAELQDNGEIKEYTLEPEDFGIAKSSLEDLLGSDPEANAKSLGTILNGEPGAKTDCALMNAGAAIYISGNAESIQDGIRRARESISSGMAMAKLDALRQITNET